jgi:hypothetical protein
MRSYSARTLGESQLRQMLPDGPIDLLKAYLPVLRAIGAMSFRVGLLSQWSLVKPAHSPIQPLFMARCHS